MLTKICILIRLIITPLGLYEKESSKGFKVHTQKHECREAPYLSKQKGKQ
jgi:hypothetical protein